MKTASFLITVLFNICVGIVLLFFLLLALNGFSERQAAPGLILFFVWVLMTAFLTAVLSMRAAKFLAVKKSLNAALAVLLSVLIFVAFGLGFNVVGLFAAVFLVSALR